jgi:hypothetical protein
MNKGAAQARTAGSAESEEKTTRMMSRSAAATYAGRASSMRRLRRRATAAHAATDRPFCRTNGCATLLDVDPATGMAVCPICGSRQRSRGVALAV